MAFQRGHIIDVIKLDDGSIKYRVKLVMTGYLVIARQVTPISNPDTSLAYTYNQDDKVIVSPVDGYTDYIVIGSETHIEPSIPSNSVAIKGKKVYLGKLDSSEPLVLGNVAVNANLDLASIMIDLVQVLLAGNCFNSTLPSSPTLPNPTGLEAFNKSIVNLEKWKAKYLENESTNILSQTAYTTR